MLVSIKYLCVKTYLFIQKKIVIILLGSYFSFRRKPKWHPYLFRSSEHIYSSREFAFAAGHLQRIVNSYEGRARFPPGSAKHKAVLPRCFNKIA